MGLQAVAPNAPYICKPQRFMKRTLKQCVYTGIDALRVTKSHAQ